MRLDKFLQTSRIIKRRTVATKLCSAGRVAVNDRSAKPGKELQVGDTIHVRFGARGEMICEVLELPTRGIRKEDAAGLYKTLLDTRTSGAGE